MNSISLNSQNRHSYQDNVLIRIAENRDIKQIQSLIKFVSKDSLEVKKIPREVTIIVAESKKNKKIIGTISLHIWDRMRSVPSSTCYLFDLAVEPTYRKNGIGDVLLRSAVVLAKKNGVGKIEFASEEKLRSYYVKKGFKPVGVHYAIYLSSKL